MKYMRILATFFGHPWALAEDKFRQAASFLARKGAGLAISEDDIAAAVGQRRAGGYGIVGRTAIIPIMGAIFHRASAIEEACGGVSAESVGQQIDAAAADPQVRRIVLQLDSPGGSVYGIQELATKIRSARESKKIVAVADPVAASAAFWIGSQAGEFYVTPSGQVGSVGVIAEHADMSKAQENEGVKTVVVTSSKYKAEGHPAQPLNDEGLAELQRKVDHYYGVMVSDIAKGRRVSEATVRSAFGEGRLMVADDAKRAGMVDGVASFEKVLRRLEAEVSRDAINARARAVEVV